VIYWVSMFSSCKTAIHSLPLRSSPTNEIKAVGSPRRAAETAAFALLPTAGTTTTSSYGILSPQRIEMVHCSVEMSQCTLASCNLINASFVTSPSVIKEAFCIVGV